MQDKDFYECAHPSEYGSLDMYKVMQALYDNGFDGYIRPIMVALSGERPDGRAMACSTAPLA